MIKANFRGRAYLLIAPAIALGVVAASGHRAAAEDADPAAKNERCATRISITLLGKSPSAQLLQSSTPQGQIDPMLEDPAFIERFARFLNASFNPLPGEVAKEDSSYFLGKYILENKKPYKDMFLGQYNVDSSTPTGADPLVTVDPDGLGYFRSQPWLLRYAGNEEKGYKLVTAYRIMQNVVGLDLIASTNAPDKDVGATTRMTDPGCKGCHADNWYALDKAAKVLTKVQRRGNNVTFTPPTDGPQQVADKTVSSDKELVQALVDSPNFSFNACRLVFNFLYGRPENVCESKVFEGCMNEFKSKGTIQAALASVAKDPGFCQ